MDRATYWTLIATMGNPCPIGLTDWYMDFPDPSDWYAPLLSKAAADHRRRLEPELVVEPAAEALYTQTQTETDPAKRIALYQQMQKIIMAQAPVVPLFQPVFNAMSLQAGGRLLRAPGVAAQVRRLLDQVRPSTRREVRRGGPGSMPAGPPATTAKRDDERDDETYEQR